MSKVLVSYFSASGVTRSVAEKIVNVVQGDLFEIEPVEKYSSADLNWMDKNSRSSIEMNDKSFRPPVSKKVNNIGDYEKVILGFPVWWYVAPTIINTFIEENDLSGKEIYVFVTSGGSGVDGCVDDLKKTYPNLNFIKGVRFSKNVSDDDIKEFVA